MAERIRVVVAKPGLDGHDRGAKVVARALRDAGMEVIYTGLHQTPEQIVQTVIAGGRRRRRPLGAVRRAHDAVRASSCELLQEREVADVVVFGGGIIPEADIPELEAMGVAQGLHARRVDGRHRRSGCAPTWPRRRPGESGLSVDRPTAG